MIPDPKELNTGSQPYMQDGFVSFGCSVMVLFHLVVQFWLGFFVCFFTPSPQFFYLGVNNFWDVTTSL